MALILTSTPMPSIQIVDAYHCIAGISVSYEDGKAACIVQSYKDAATREAFKAVTAELAILEKEYDAIHKTLGDAQAAKDYVAAQKAQLDLFQKGIDVQEKRKELESVKPFGAQEIAAIEVADNLATNGEITRADLYALIKTRSAWAGARDI
ncbi:MAG: hypothetical protein ACNI26_08270 [Terasakiella sp.]|uniref:hypothetical protein n=1 Tax=unclassified Terasakiella TaxID=2614952 RepID=UPI003AFFA60A